MPPLVVFLFNQMSRCNQLELDWLKVPEGLSKIGRDRGILKQIEFYYKLKPILTTGSFQKKGMVTFIKKYHDISKSTIHLRMNELVKLGFAVDYGKRYNLIAYDKLFDLLGYDIKYRWKGRQYPRRGDFGITKIVSEYSQANLTDAIDLTAIKRIISQQLRMLALKNIKASYKTDGDTYQISANQIKSEISQITSNYGYSKWLEVFDLTGIQVTDLLPANIEEAFTAKNEKGQEMNYIVGVSNRKICSILGYRSNKSIVDLKNRCAKNDMLIVTNRICEIDLDLRGFGNSYILSQLQELSPNFFRKGMKVFFRLSDALEVKL